VGASPPDLVGFMTSGEAKPVRLISRLDIKGTNLIKGIRFEGLRVIGSPNEKARQYYDQGIDELLYIDAVASLYNRSYLGELVTEVVKDVFVPITVGGGIRSVDDVRALLRAGADKVAINTAAVKDPALLTRVAESFGRQCVVLSVEAKSVAPGKWEVYTEGGREKSGRDVAEWIAEGIERGAGELLVTSVDHDGTETGADIELMKMAGELSTVPVIASGGIGSAAHAQELVDSANVDAIALGRALHYGRLELSSLRHSLRSNGVGVRDYVDA
jgi:cyclase